MNGLAVSMMSILPGAANSSSTSAHWYFSAGFSAGNSRVFRSINCEKKRLTSSAPAFRSPGLMPT
ncbi:hypothetical protein R69746_08584 [Paraburkholderia aspalathi]|nr:hypothetical protein R69746_08584 [Paraburkholderia aspalathi]